MASGVCASVPGNLGHKQAGVGLVSLYFFFSLNGFIVYLLFCLFPSILGGNLIHSHLPLSFHCLLGSPHVHLDCFVSSCYKVAVGFAGEGGRIPQSGYKDVGLLG